MKTNSFRKNTYGAVAALTVFTISAAAIPDQAAQAATFGSHAFFWMETATPPAGSPGLNPHPSFRFCKNQGRLSCTINVMKPPGWVEAYYTVGISGPNGLSFPYDPIYFATPYGTSNAYCQTNSHAGGYDVLCSRATQLSARYVSNTGAAGSGHAAYGYVNFWGTVSRSFNSTGRANTARRRGEGLYTVTVGGLGAQERVSNGIAQVQASRSGDDANRLRGLCTIESVGSSTVADAIDINVRCARHDGQLVDNDFSFIYEMAGGDLLSLVWLDVAGVGAQPYFPRQTSNSRNSVRRRTDSSGRLLTGRYIVNLPGVAATGTNVQLSASGYASNYCNVENWSSDGAGGVNVGVSCFRLTTNGPVPTNSQFHLGYYGRR